MLGDHATVLREYLSINHVRRAEPNKRGGRPPPPVLIASLQIKNISGFQSHITEPVILISGSSSRISNKISTEMNRQAP